jgi:hypothetical protein
MTSTIYQQKIYLVVQGTSCNDIIKMIHKESNETNTNINNISLQSSERFSKLDEIGMKEMFLVRKSPDNQSILGIKDTSTIYPKILTSLDVAAIESAFVLYYNQTENIQISPIPYLTNHSGVSNIRTFDELKEVFESGNTSKYWNKRNLSTNLDSNINSLKTKVPRIDWRLCSNDIQFQEKNIGARLKRVNKKTSKSQFQSFRFSSFQKDILNPLISENISLTPFEQNTELYNQSKGKKLKPIVMIVNFDTVKDFLNEIPKKRYQEGTTKIERGSIWEIEMKITETIQGNRIKYDYLYLNSTKKYPTELNQTDLSFNKASRDYSFRYKNKKYKLFMANETIPMDTLIQYECKFCRYENQMREALKKIYEKKYPNRKINNNVNKNVKRKNITNRANSFENIVKTLVE